MLKKISRSFLTLVLAVICVSLFAVSTKVIAESKLNFELIPMHYGLIKGEPLTKGENRGFLNFSLNANAKKGDEQLVLTGNYYLHPSELFVYRSTSGVYYVAQVKEVTANVVSLMNPLKEDISVGNNLWNFYNDSSHPNRSGFKAVADYALKHLKTENLANKIHGFVGDSWFDNGSLVPHLSSKLNATYIINKGDGGRKTSDVLNEFDEDFPISANVQPDYIWVILGTNDYWDEMPRETYIENIEKIIKKINALGAKAIVFTPSVAPLVHDVNTPVGSGVFTSFFHDLSNDYADDLLALYQKTRGEINAYVQDSNLVIELSATSPLSNDFHYLYFIDTDNDAKTGYTSSYSKWGETGSDYLVQDDSVYESFSNENWEWGNKGSVVSTSLNKVVISKNDLGLTLGSGKKMIIKIGVLVYSNDWNTIEDIYPKSGKMKEILIDNPLVTQAEAVKDVVTTTRGTPVTIDALANDTGVGRLTIGWFDNPDNGSIKVVNNQLIYMPNAGFLGDDEFWYEMIDSTGKSDWGKILVTVDNIVTGFNANNDTATVILGNTVRIDVLSNDTGANLVLEDVDDVWTGSIMRVRNALEYKSDGNYIGEVVVWYGISNLNGDSKWAKVTIDIIP